MGRAVVQCYFQGGAFAFAPPPLRRFSGGPFRRVADEGDETDHLLSLFFVVDARVFFFSLPLSQREEEKKK
jgi:hypothetical protein